MHITHLRFLPLADEPFRVLVRDKQDRSRRVVRQSAHRGQHCAGLFIGAEDLARLEALPGFVSNYLAARETCINSQGPCYGRVSMPRYIALILVGLIYAGSTATLAIAAQIGGSGPVEIFSCDVDLNECKCDGTWEGASCKAMRKNCKDEGIEHGCHTGKVKYCTCQMSLQKSPSARIPQIKTPPGGMKFQKTPSVRDGGTVKRKVR